MNQFCCNFWFLFFYLLGFRFRGSRGEHLDGIGIQTNVMDMNGSTRHRSPLPPPPTTVHLVNGNGTVEQWSKLADQTNGQDQVKIKKIRNLFEILWKIINSMLFFIFFRIIWVQHQVAKIRIRQAIHVEIHRQRIHKVVLKVLHKCLAT